MINTYEEKVTVNHISLLTRIGLIVWCFALMFGVIVAFSALFPNNADYRVWAWAVAAKVSMPILTVITIAQWVAHEALHCLFFKIYGKFAQFGFKLWTKVGPVCYATSAGNMFSRWQYVQISLAPQLFTALCLSLAIFLHMPAIVWMSVVTMGAGCFGGGIFDMYASYRVLKLPRGAMIEDVKDGWKVYLYPEMEVES